MLTHPDLLPETSDAGELQRRRVLADHLRDNEILRHCVAAAQLKALMRTMMSKDASEREEARQLFNAIESVMDELAITIQRGEYAEALSRRAE
jgi:hypothetical protein